MHAIWQRSGTGPATSSDFAQTNASSRRAPREGEGAAFANVRGQRHAMRLAQDRRIVAIGDDHARPLRQERRTVQRRGIEPRRHRPVIAVAVTEIVGPFAVTHQVGARHLDLDDHQLSARVDRHQVGTAAALQRDFGDGDEVVAQQHPRDAARDVGGADRGIAALNARNRSHVEHDPGLEHSANEASAPWRINDRRRGCRSSRSW
jgi:hypothetical protein